MTGAIRLIDWNPAVTTTITEPGVYNIPADAYHADPVKGGSLSSSGARKLLEPSCPELFKYELDHPPTPTDDMTFGSAVHKLFLGAGNEVVVVDADSWRTNVAKEAKATALAEGNHPILAAESRKAKQMVAALHRHPAAARLVDTERGTAEQTLFWICQQTGVPCRAMLDWIPAPTRGYRLVAVDLKTCPSAAKEKVSRTIWDLGYFIQGWWYLDGLRSLGIGERPALVFIFQERTPPYLVCPYELNALAEEAGGFYSLKARRIYAECIETGRWPSYSDDIESVGLPPWGQTTYFQESGL